jgi:hypothetical protein
MSNRLVSFLSTIERSFHSSAPAEGSWANLRTINYQLGLARLTLGTRQGQEPIRLRGSILLEAFKLADGSPCVKANLSWSDQPGATGFIHAIYPKPETDWDAEAQQVASTWLSGAPASKVEELAPAETHQLAAAV